MIGNTRNKPRQMIECHSIRYHIGIIMIAIWFVIISCFSPQSTQASVSNDQGGFFNQRYRGWLWFEEKTKESEQQKRQAQNAQAEVITPEAAKAEIEQFAKELEDAKYVMLARPNPQNVKAYKDKEAQMWASATKLQESWDTANFLYPQHQDLINEPINVHAVKLKREVDRADDGVLITELAKSFDLVLFFKGGCKYCKAFEPVLKSFGETYGFKIEAITMDNTKSEFFHTASMPNLVKDLEIDAAPTLVAVSKDGKVAFELIRGYASISELEDYSIRAAKHLANRAEEQKVSKNIRRRKQ